MPLAGLPRQEGTGPGVGLVGGTPSLGTALGGRPGTSLTLLLPCTRPSLRSRDVWPAGRCTASILAARAFRLDVALGMEWSARPLGLDSSSPRKTAAAPARGSPRAWGGADTTQFCSRLDLRTGGAGGTAPLGLGKKPPLRAKVFLLLGEAFRLPEQMASARVSPQDTAGVVTPRVVAPLRNGGIRATASGLRPTLAATSHPSPSFWAPASTACTSGSREVPRGGLEAPTAEASCSMSQSLARSSQGSSNGPPGLGGLRLARVQPARLAKEVVLGFRGRLEWMVWAVAVPRVDVAQGSLTGRARAAAVASRGRGLRAGPELSGPPCSEDLQLLSSRTLLRGGVSGGPGPAGKLGLKGGPGVGLELSAVHTLTSLSQELMDGPELLPAQAVPSRAPAEPQGPSGACEV